MKPGMPDGRVTQAGERAAGAYAAALVVTIIIANNGVDLRKVITPEAREQNAPAGKGLSRKRRAPSNSLAPPEGRADRVCLLDVGFLRLPIENRKEIEVTTVHKEPFVAVLPSWHPHSAKKEIHLRELKGNPFVMYAREHAPGFHDLLSGILSNAGVVPKVVQSAGEMSTLISLVDAGVGVSIVPPSAAKRFVSKGDRVLNCGSTAGVRDWLGPRTPKHCGGSAPVL